MSENFVETIEIRQSNRVKIAVSDTRVSAVRLCPSTGIQTYNMSP